MATGILRLSDGTTTIDFHSASYNVLKGGLDLTPPPLNSQYIASPFIDGDRLAGARYTNRVITINLLVLGASLSDLRASIRSIHRLLNDAKERVLLGYGSKVYLEYQWGLTAGDSVYFDVLSGFLSLPGDFSSPMLWRNTLLHGARLSLNCKPFGRYTNQNYAQQTLENEQDGANLNYFDVANTVNGDVPSKLYLKVDLTGATGSKKLWIARRSGTRYNDSLFTQGEDEISNTNLVDSFHHLVFSDEVLAAASASAFKRLSLKLGKAITAETVIARIAYEFLAPPPRGQYRVLARVRCTDVDHATDFNKMKWGVGWLYGTIYSYTPTVSAGDYYAPDADNTWQTLDLGLLNIPPLGESEIAGNSTFQLRLFQLISAAISGVVGYTSPDGFVDGGAVWSNEANAYDENTATFADCNVAGAWSDYLELTHAGVECTGVRFWLTDQSGHVTDVDVDAFYDGIWNHVYEGTFAKGAWVEKYLDTKHTVTSWRFRFKTDGNADVARVNEVDYIDATQGDEYQWDCDYIFLLPVDEGCVIIDDVAAADVLAIDGISDPPGVFKIDGSNLIIDTPDYVGKPFSLGREITRIYILRDDVKGVTFIVDPKYQPAYLVV